nr:hypothetical protein [Tanacetum cinerariifolium]
MVYSFIHSSRIMHGTYHLTYYIHDTTYCSYYPLHISIHPHRSVDDTPDTLPSPTHVTPPVEPIPDGRPYRYLPNGPVNMLTAKKRVGPLPTHHLSVRHSVDYSSSDHFTSDDSSKDSPSDSSSETSSDSSSDALFDSSSGHSSLDHSSPALPSDLEVSSDESFESSVPREIGSRVDVDVRGSKEPYSEPDIDLKVQVEIDKCIAYVDALRDRGIDARVAIETVA